MFFKSDWIPCRDTQSGQKCKQYFTEYLHYWLQAPQTCGARRRALWMARVLWYAQAS